MTTEDRCRSAIKYGTTLATRCMLPAFHKIIHPTDSHVGKGLREFDYQRVEWFDEDRRVFDSDREDEYSWEQT